jgi:hypothetical protein
MIYFRYFSSDSFLFPPYLITDSVFDKYARWNFLVQTYNLLREARSFTPFPQEPATDLYADACGSVAHANVFLFIIRFDMIWYIC